MSLSDSDKDALIAQLQRQLAEVLQANQQILQSQQSKPSHPEIAPKPIEKDTLPCCFLDTIPLETRNMIYGYLLVNNVLSTTKTLLYWSDDIQQDPDGIAGNAEAEVQHYGLSPAILRANKQIHVEASAVLYGDNTFIIIP
ncbi:hypothetical protein G7Y89_g12436 [Cudoniella acicularis]|uniref:Uncharacterized protein n=1 Tax=Cudoniella acicularis TaxID=354080 RepID=A0A8H4R959_9HELO|nr:hypothetical protein G7Y89_g12436 [Cudoniella acicularis]